MSPPFSAVDTATAAGPSNADLCVRVDELTRQVSTLNDTVAQQSQMIMMLLRQQSDMLKKLFAQGEKTAKCASSVARHFRHDDKDDDATGQGQDEQTPAFNPTAQTFNVASAQGEPVQQQPGGASGSQQVDDEDDDMAQWAVLLNLNEDEHPLLDDIGDFDFSIMDPTQGEPIDLENIYSTETFTTAPICSAPTSSGVVNLQNIRNLVEEDTSSQAAEASQPNIVNEPTNLRTRDWFRRKIVPTLYKDSISLSNAIDMQKRIICWFYDDELNLIAIKRVDGVQYFRCSVTVISSLSISDLKELSYLQMVNRTHHYPALYVESIVQREGKHGDFNILTPSKPKQVKDRSQPRDPATGRHPWKLTRPPIQDEKNVRLKKLPQNILSNLSFWQVDSRTGEAVMIDHQYREVLRVYDPLHMVNLSKTDLLQLSQAELIVTEEHLRVVGERYMSFVKACLRKDVHADCKKF